MKPVLSDPEMKALAEAISSSGLLSIARFTPEHLRASVAAMRQPSSVQVQSVVDKELTSGSGNVIPVRRYVPAGSPLAEIIYFHGGGWSLGSIEDYDHFLRVLTVATGCIINSVEYRLAPEHVFPAAVDDAWRAVKSLASAEHPTIVAGDSAGGNLAAVVAQMARSEGGPRLAGQVLIYPFTNGDLEAPGLSAFEAPVLPREDIAAFVDLYVPNSVDRRDPRFSPLDGDVQGLPPALIITAEADLLVSHGTDYAQRLADAGVAVTLFQRDSAVHGYMTLMPESVAAQATMTEIAAFITRVM